VDEEEEEELRAYEEEAEEEEEEEEEVQGDRNAMAMLEAAGAEHRYAIRSLLLLNRSIFRSILLLLLSSNAGGGGPSTLAAAFLPALSTGVQERE
jgi:regulator of protease activity HflC (stomatin/prohibitin superfamily)